MFFLFISKWSTIIEVAYTKFLTELWRQYKYMFVSTVYLFLGRLLKFFLLAFH